MPGSVMWAPIDDAMLTIAPPPCPRMEAISCFIDSHVPVVLAHTTDHAS